MEFHTELPHLLLDALIRVIRGVLQNVELVLLEFVWPTHMTRKAEEYTSRVILRISVITITTMLL